MSERYAAASEAVVSPLAACWTRCVRTAEEGHRVFGGEHEWRLFSRTEIQRYMPPEDGQTSPPTDAQIRQRSKTVYDEVWYCVHCTTEVERRLEP